MKRALAVVIILALILTQFGYAETEKISYVSAYCLGNVFEGSSIDLLIYNGEAYITLETAEALSGYTFEGLSEEVVMLETAEVLSGYTFEEEAVMPRCVFSGPDWERSFYVDEYIHDLAGVWYMALEDMHFLDTSIIQFPTFLYARAKEGSLKELKEITDSIINDPLYRIPDFDSDMWGRVAEVGTVLYEFANNVTLFDGDLLTGKYYKDTYEAIILGMIREDGDDPIVTSLAKKGSNLAKLTSKLAEADLENKLDFRIDFKKAADYDNFDWESYLDLARTDNFPVDSVLVSEAGKALDIALDPLAYAVKEATGDMVELGGADIISILELVDYTNTVVNCSSVYFDLFQYAYEQAYIDDEEGEYLPVEAQNIIKDIQKYAMSEEKWDSISVAARKGIGDIATKTGEATIQEALSSALGGMDKAVRLAMVPVSAFMDKVGPAKDGAAKIEFTKKYHCLDRLQKGIAGLYKEYAKEYEKGNYEYFLNLKYSALLYIAYAKEYYDAYCEATGEKTTFPCEVDIDRLMNLSDYDLMIPAECDDIDLDELSIVGEENHIEQEANIANGNGWASRKGIWWQDSPNAEFLESELIIHEVTSDAVLFSLGIYRITEYPFLVGRINDDNSVYFEYREDDNYRIAGTLKLEDTGISLETDYDFSDIGVQTIDWQTGEEYPAVFSTKGDRPLLNMPLFKMKRLEDFSVRNGVQFGKTFDEILEIENENYFNEKGEDLRKYYRVHEIYFRSGDIDMPVYDVSVAGIKGASIHYQFDQNDRLNYFYYWFRSDSSKPFDEREVYEKLRETLENKYGYRSHYEVVRDEYLEPTGKLSLNKGLNWLEEGSEFYEWIIELESGGYLDITLAFDTGEWDDIYLRYNYISRSELHELMSEFVERELTQEIELDRDL